MPYAPLLPEPQLTDAMQRLTDWTREGDWISRTIRCASFGEAIDLVNRVAEAAEAADHHPDIQIVWRRVTFRLTTKAAGGLTQRDVDMAGQIDRLVHEPVA